MPKDTSTWGAAFKQNVIWFVFAIILAAGATFINSQQTSVAIKAQITSLERRITDLEDQTLENREKVTEVREDLVRLEGKINQLLIIQGINPKDFKPIPQDSKNQQ